MELHYSHNFFAGVQCVAVQASAEIQSEPAAVVGPDETAPFPVVGEVVAVGFAEDESRALPTVHEAVLVAAAPAQAVVVAAETVQAVLVVVKAVLVTSDVG